MFRKVIKKLLELTVKPLIIRYLRKSRSFKYRNFKMTVLPGVFHPLLFHTTLVMARYLHSLDVKNKTFLELGCGSGLLSLIASSKGGIVTAIDLNPKAVENTSTNAQINNLPVKVYLSDLFQKLEKQNFDFIFINPPFYPVNPSDEKELAWYCGENFNYFNKLFKTLPPYYDNKSAVIIILSEDCNIQKIKQIAEENMQTLHLLFSKQTFTEKEFVFTIKKLTDKNLTVN